MDTITICGTDFELVRETDESKLLDVGKLLRTVKMYGGGTVICHHTDAGKPLYYSEHGAVDDPRVYESEAMCCEALMQALRDKLMAEYPLPRRVVLAAKLEGGVLSGLGDDVFCGRRAA